MAKKYEELRQLAMIQQAGGPLRTYFGGKFKNEKGFWQSQLNPRSLSYETFNVLLRNRIYENKGMKTQEWNLKHFYKHKQKF